MKIFLIGAAYPLRGGIAHYIALLYHHLTMHAHDVQIITFSRQYPKMLFPGKSQEEVRSGGVAVPSHRMIDSINPWTWISTARWIRSQKPDLIVFKYWLPFFGPCFGTIAATVRRNRHTRVAFICDNVIPHERRIGDRAFTRFAFRFVDTFIVQSRAVERELQAFLPEASSRFVPHPVYEIFGPAIPKARAQEQLSLPPSPVLLFFGYIRPYKGLDVLLQALPLVLKHRSVILLVVGESYEGTAHYLKRASDLGITNAVVLHTEYVPNDSVSMYFSACDAVVLPYRSATQSGIVQIAYQFGRPVIATDVGGLAEVVLHEETGLIVPPDDPRALADAIVRFYDEKLEERFVARVMQERTKYTWDVLVEALEKAASPQEGI
jgi:glycosyltransferase involved in cell wall biosynthesis